MRKAVLIAASCLLSGCVTRSPSVPEPPQSAALAYDPRLLVDIPAEPSIRGGLIQPATAEERAALEAFLTGEAEARAWGREGWARAELARKACAPVSPAAAR